MGPETWPQVAGIGGLAAGFAGIVWKMFNNQSQQQAALFQQLLEVLKEHSKATAADAEAKTKMAEAVRSLDANLTVNTATTQASKEAINTLLSHLVLKQPPTV